MLEVDGDRVTDPPSLRPSELLAISARRGSLIVQFSEPEACGEEVLRSLNEACRLAPDRIRVRFYGHYWAPFDATLLRLLPDVADLAVDHLRSILHEDEIGRLPHLRHLSLGVFEWDRPDFLETLDLSRLEGLGLGENRKRNLDLSPLKQCRSLNELVVEGHSKGMDAIAGSPCLKKLTLRSRAKSQALDFIAAIPNLSELRLILGARQDIEDLSSKTLELLQIIRVRGLTTLGDLSRLPALSALHVEDQLQVTKLDLNGVRLERLKLFNCRNLAELVGLDGQDRLSEFHVWRVALDLDALRDRDWPEATRSVGLYSGRRNWDDDAKARLTARGLGERGSSWP